MFVAFILLSFYFYIRGFKISALIIFFFFLTRGFDLIPDSMVELRVPLTKNVDYAFFILMGFLSIEFVFNTKVLLKIDTLSKYLMAFFIFLVACIIYNRSSLNVQSGEIIRTVRHYFLWLTYFVLRNMTKDQLKRLLKFLFVMTAITSVLFLVQIVINTRILVGVTKATAQFLGMTFPRFYNQPAMIDFFVFMAVYYNPFKGRMRYVTTIVLGLAFLGAFHRSHIGVYFVCLFLGYLMRLSKQKLLKRSLICIPLLVLFFIFSNGKSAEDEQSRTMTDLQSVLSGKALNFDEYVETIGSDATFTFRVAHLVERNEYIKQSIASMLFGGALLTEDSKMVDKMFDFKVGLLEEMTNQVIQLDTADIVYSVLFIRFGYFGTFLFLLIYFYLIFYFYRNRKHPLAFLSFWFLLYSMGISFFSITLMSPVTFLLPAICYLIIQKGKRESVDEEILVNE